MKKIEIRNSNSPYFNLVWIEKREKLLFEIWNLDQ